MAKKGKSKISASDKKNIKTTLIVLLGTALIGGIFLFFHREKEIKPKTAVHGTVPKKTFVQKFPLGSGSKIAFIFDDWGYNTHDCHYLKEIKAPLAVSILPDLRHSTDIMKCAAIHNKDIMLHLPMEAYHNNDPYPDGYLITTKMSVTQVEKRLDEIFKKMPLIMGVNNHMGSKATEDEALMTIVFKKIHRKGLFFVDSMTAPHHSVGGELAEQMRIPFAKRDIFLDNINTREAIEKQIAVLARIARRQGYAIAIGHDRQLTLQIMEEEIPILQKQGFEIVHVKDLLRNRR